MRINLRQEIAMWVLGLLWTGLTFLALTEAGIGEPGVLGLQTLPAMLVLLVPIFLIIFSLRDRKKTD